MGIIRSRRSRETSRSNTRNRFRAVRVIDIILDINHPLAGEYGNYDSIGTIFYTDLDDNNPNLLPKDASTASPLFSHLKYYPLINEVVLILSTTSKDYLDDRLSRADYYFPPINLCGDNAAMIAYAGFIRKKYNLKEYPTKFARPRWPLGELYD